MRARRWWVIAGVLVALGVALFIFKNAPTKVANSSYVQKDITVHGERVRVDIADTSALREQGLSGRARLAPTTGMLFVFQQDGHYAFWMKDMRFSIDMVWLASDGSIVGLFENVAPESYPKSFVPDGGARYVLELPRGYVHAHGVKVGDRIDL